MKKLLPLKPKKVEYDFPLVNWILAANDKYKLEEMHRRIIADQSLDDLLGSADEKLAARVRRIVKEIVSCQFSNPMRPVIELISNSCDARPKDACDYRIDVTWKNYGVIVSDKGDSMNLDSILRFLLIPFNNQKYEDADQEYIGKFGIGLFSAFQYCMENSCAENLSWESPKNCVEIATRSHSDAGKCIDKPFGESYRLKIYATTEELSSLRLRLAKFNKRTQGTRVEVNKCFDINSLRNYVRNETKHVHPLQARIFFNNELVNASKNKSYSADVLLETLKKEYTTRQIVLERIDNSQSIDLSSLTVTVKGYALSDPPGLHLLFPRLVSPTIGRDGFTQNANYFSCAKAAFIPLYDLISDSIREDPGCRERMCELIPSLATTVGLDSVNEIPNLDALIQLVLPEKKYVLLKHERDLILPFLGADIDKKIFVSSHQCYSLWTQKFKCFKSLISEHTSLLCSYDYKQFEEEVRACSLTSAALKPGSAVNNPNLRLLFLEICRKNFGQPKFSQVSIIAHDPAPLPFLYNEQQEHLYINAKHKYIQGDYNSLKSNVLISKYLQLPHIASQFSQQSNYLETIMLSLSSKMNPKTGDVGCAYVQSQNLNFQSSTLR